VRVVEPAVAYPEEDKPVVQPVGPARPELDLVAGDPETPPEVGDGDIGWITTIRPLGRIPLVSLLQTGPALDDL
jgi:hypothetical protein